MSLSMGAFDPDEGLVRLRDRILAGEVVFFIGAGLSLDSEHNTAHRLIVRLLVRFTAFTTCMAEQGQAFAKASAQNLHDTLVSTFGLELSDNANEGLLTDPNIQKLAQNYYSINDWICSAYEFLLDDLGRHSETEILIGSICQLENHLRLQIGRRSGRA